MKAARRVPPGPRGLDVLRFFGGGSFARTLHCFQEVSARYGPIASFTIAGRRLHLVTAPELVREVLVVQQQRFTKANGAAVLCDLLGASMLTVDEPRHREQRRIVQPAFHAQRIDGYGNAMIAETLAATHSWQDGDAIDIGAAMVRLALAIVGRALLGSDMRDRTKALETTLADAMRIVSWLGPILEALPAWANDMRLALPFPVNARLAQARQAMAAIVQRAIDEHGANAGQRAVNDRADGADVDSLLSLLLLTHDARGAPLDVQTIADELVTVLLAGHETTANALTWSWYALARDPAIGARVASEVEAVAPDRDVRASDFSQLSFTASIFAEVLRLYPPASAFGRRAREDCQLGGFDIAAGDGILLSPYVSHRNPIIFPQPQEFVPSRWQEQKPPPFAYFPFGGGARLCIGEAFARMEGTLVLATIARRWQLRAIDGAPVGIAAHATLRPQSPIVLRAARRGTDGAHACASR